MKSGWMPRLAKIKESGVHGILKSTLPAITPAAWAAFQTGLLPGRTGVYNFADWDEKSRRVVPVSSASLDNTVWEVAGSHGLKVGAVNVPLTYPPKKVNGVIISGLLTPSLDSSFTHPPEFREELLREIPDYHIFNMENIKEDWARLDYDHLLDHLVHAIDIRAKAARLLMDTEQPSLVMVHFQATDVLQHALWADLDSEHPAYRKERRDIMFDKFFRSLDDKIAELIEAFEACSPEPTAVMVVSDHGFQAHRKRFNLRWWLEREGFLVKNVRVDKPSAIVSIVKFLDVFNLRRVLFSEKMRTEVGSAIHRLEGVAHEIDFGKSSAISFGRSNEGFIFLLERNEPRREKVEQNLIEMLSEIRDPETGDLVVKKVHRKSDIFEGEYFDRMPDLVVEPEGPCSITGNPEPGNELFVEAEPGEDFHAGRHHPDGIFMAQGHGIATGPRNDASIVDVAPTLYHYLGLSVPDDLDGCLRKEWFTDEFLADNPPTFTQTVKKDARNGRGEVYSEDEEEAIKKRLKDLGYL